ncbi:hypothetical protein GCM10011521_08920 [Arenimonas soli]|uniref:M23ase beta-sheet core domain-containing protein n=1 Tax=Arenimonas soli TaxID=2269504 RepID=A0ABQ1HF24_9GAMM|nr:peptidoglycan DD-metalloendopeptidase family protein [Arenimonas soli]GGA72996.1 hypothetical protein GCM10011521_08920 [Arenimonas soli]
MRRHCALLALAAAFALPVFAVPPDGGQGLDDGAFSDHLTPELDKRLADEAIANIAMLRREGRLPEAQAKVSGLVWPLGPVDGAGTDLHGISNFVDLDAAYPSHLRDYSCGTRTYDTTSGYNHPGIDYFIWPFAWHLMDQGAVDVRAIAPGTLIASGDGNNDRSCSMNAPNTPNYVVIRHADGTVARYLHFKKDSVTTLPIGSAIAAGQVIGKVGSSGISTGPHLHVEIRASEIAGAAAFEPHAGDCNSVASGWVDQRPYRDSAINQLSTHSATPTLLGCPTVGTIQHNTDQPRYKDHFQPGDPITLMAAYRDQGRGQVTQFRVLRPDQSVFTSWNFDMSEQGATPQYYSAAYWYWSHSLPLDAPDGLWTYEATFEGETKRHFFRVGDTTTAVGDMRGLIGAWYEPATSGQGFELQWINGNTALLFFYGHRDDGSNMFLIGQRDGAWDFGQEVVFELYETRGGRFNGLDPGAIQRPTWGQARVTWVSCETAVAELDGPDGTQVLTLERLGRTTGLDCN